MPEGKAAATMPANTTPALGEDPSIYCRVCKYALNLYLPTGSSIARLQHAIDPSDGHIPGPVPLAQLPDAIQCCDFCATGIVTFVYVTSEDYIRQETRVVKRWVTRRDQLEHGSAARSRRTETEEGHRHLFGRRHACCPGCAILIEQEDLPRLVTRVVETLPAKFQRGNRLVKARSQLCADFGHVLDHRLPGRYRITSTAPLGVWEPGPARDNPAGTR
jgi:hypothetical protein